MEAGSLLKREVSVKRGVKHTPAFQGDFLLQNKLKEKWKGRKALALGFAALSLGGAPPSSSSGRAHGTSPLLGNSEPCYLFPWRGCASPPRRPGGRSEPQPG